MEKDTPPLTSRQKDIILKLRELDRMALAIFIAAILSEVENGDNWTEDDHVIFKVWASLELVYSKSGTN